MPLFKVLTRITGAQGSPWLNTMMFHSNGTLTAQAAATAGAAFWGSVDALMDNSTSWVQDPTVVEFDETNGTPTEFLTVTTGSGTGATNAVSLPYATQALCRLYTGDVVNGHQVRGRIFIPGITQNNLGEGVPNAALITAVDAAAATLIADVNSSICVWSRPVDAEHATPNSPERDGSLHLVGSASTSPQFAVLTSRRD